MHQSGASRITQAAADRQNRNPPKRKRPVAWKYDAGKGKYHPADYADYNSYYLAEHDEREEMRKKVGKRTR